MTMEFVIDEEFEGERLDHFLSEKVEDLSRSHAQKIIKDGYVTVSGAFAKPSHRLHLDEIVGVELPPPQEVEPKPENIPLNIVYEDKDLLVIDKPSSMVVHPSAGNYSGTLVNALLFHCKNLSGIGGELKPGIVHRLDKDTSGLMVVAKNDKAHQSLSKQIQERLAKRTYIALVEDNVSQDEGVVSAPIGRSLRDRKKMAVLTPGKGKSREAVTKFKVLERFEGYTFIEAELQTGRTHQIRVHMAYIKHPIVGDPTYGRKKQKFNLDRQMLHAYKLSFTHPRTGKLMEFTSPVPSDIQRILDILRKQKG